MANYFAVFDDDTDSVWEAEQMGVVASRPTIFVFVPIVRTDRVATNQLYAGLELATYVATGIDKLAECNGAAATTVDGATMSAIILQNEFKTGAVKFIHEYFGIAATDIDSRKGAKMFDVGKIIDK